MHLKKMAVLQADLLLYRFSQTPVLGTLIRALHPRKADLQALASGPITLTREEFAQIREYGPFFRFRGIQLHSGLAITTNPDPQSENDGFLSDLDDAVPGIIIANDRGIDPRKLGDHKQPQWRNLGYPPDALRSTFSLRQAIPVLRTCTLELHHCLVIARTAGTFIAGESGSDPVQQYRLACTLALPITGIRFIMVQLAEAGTVQR